MPKPHSAQADRGASRDIGAIRESMLGRGGSTILRLPGGSEEVRDIYHYADIDLLSESTHIGTAKQIPTPEKTPKKDVLSYIYELNKNKSPSWKRESTGRGSDKKTRK